MQLQTGKTLIATRVSSLQVPEKKVLTQPAWVLRIEVNWSVIAKLGIIIHLNFSTLFELLSLD